MGRDETSRFGSLLLRHRRAAGLTQEELAEQAGLSVRAISDIERSVRRPRRDTAELLLAALRLSPAERTAFEIAARGGRAAEAPRQQQTPLPQTGNFLGAHPPTELIGRVEELGRAMSLVGEVDEGGGRMVMVVGEPGVGKTRVAQEIARLARDQGFLVATGRCYEEEQSAPFYPFVEALTLAYEVAPKSIRDHVPERWPALAMLVEAGSAPAGRPGGDGQQAEFRLFRAVSGFLSEVAGVTPVAVLLDDLHWADSASLKLILHLARHTRNHRVFLLGTYRDIEVNPQHPLERALIDLNRERLMERVALHRPEEESTRALIASIVGEIDGVAPLAAAVHEATGGNPFFVQEVMQALMERGDLYQREGRWQLRTIGDTRVPDTVQATIRERVWRLSPDAREVLFEASVLGQTFSFDDLWGMCDCPEEEVETGLQEATRAGLIRETERDSYAFSHALTHRALYEELPGRRRRRLHLLAGESLERLPPRVRRQRVSELAWHFLEGADEARAARYAMEAGDRALEAFAYPEAEQYYRTVLELTAAAGYDDPADETRLLEAEALGKLGRVLNIVHRYDEALATLDRAAMAYRHQGDLMHEGQCVAEIGWIHRARGTIEEGIARIGPYLRALEEAEPPQVPSFILSALYTAQARLSFRLCRYEEELAAVERAVDLAAGDDVTLAVAESLKGRALMNLGRREPAREMLEGAIARAAAVGQIGPMSVALENLGEIHRDRGEFQQGKMYLERAVAAAEQTHVPTRIGWSTCKLGHICFLLGDWSEAIRHFEHAEEVFATVDEPRPGIYAVIFSAQLALAQGISEGRRRLQQVADEAAALSDLWALRLAQLLLAEQDLLVGNPHGATQRLEPLLDRSGLKEPQVTLLLPTLARADAETGRDERAEGLLVEAMRRAEEHSHVLALSGCLRARAFLRSRQERWDEAIADFDRVISLLERMPYPYAEGRARHEYGQMLNGQGAREAARRELDAASVIFARLGAQPYVTQAIS